MKVCLRAWVDKPQTDKVDELKVIWEKRDIIPTAGLETLLSSPSDILDYIYFEDDAKRTVILNPARIADKADYPNPQNYVVQ